MTEIDRWFYVDFMLTLDGCFALICRKSSQLDRIE